MVHAEAATFDALEKKPLLLDAKLEAYLSSKKGRFASGQSGCGNSVPIRSLAKMSRPFPASLRNPETVSSVRGRYRHRNSHSKRSDRTRPSRSRPAVPKTCGTAKPVIRPLVTTSTPTAERNPGQIPPASQTRGFPLSSRRLRRARPYAVPGECRLVSYCATDGEKTRELQTFRRSRNRRSAGSWRSNSNKEILD